MANKEVVTLADQPRLFPVHEVNKSNIEPPSHTIVYDFHPEIFTFVVLAQQLTGIPDIAPRPSLFRHKPGMDPQIEAIALSKYVYDKSGADRGILM